jgi:hypothetical protein
MGTYLYPTVGIGFLMGMSWHVYLYPSVGKDENGTEIFRIDRFRFLHYDIVFYIIKPFSNFVTHKTLSVLVGFTTIFIYFLYSLIAKINIPYRPFSTL